jgi:hypothetical protein
MLGCFTGTWSSSLHLRGVLDLYLTLGSFLGSWLISLRGVLDLYLSKDVARVLGPDLYQSLGGSMSEVVGLPKNSYKPNTNTAWVRTQLCKLQTRGSAQ